MPLYLFVKVVAVVLPMSASKSYISQSWWTQYQIVHLTNIPVSVVKAADLEMWRQISQSEFQVLFFESFLSFDRAKNLSRYGRL